MGLNEHSVTGKQKIQRHKLELEIKRSGLLCDFYENKLDEYGEVTNEKQIILEKVPCLFHNVRGYAVQKEKEGSIVVAKGQPKLLMLYKESIKNKLHNGCYVVIDSKVYKISYLYYSLNLFVELFLEVVLEDDF